MTTHSSPLASADPPVEEAEPNRRTSRFDERGVALQTVIIIVVMLAIAGTVAGVLLSRADDVTNQLEAQEVITGLVTNQTTCRAHQMGTVAGTVNTSKCTWTEGSNTAAPPNVTQSRCLLVRGKYTPGTSGSAAVCEVDI